MPEQFRVPGPRSLHALLAVVVVVALVLGVTGMVTSWDYGVADDVPAAKVESHAAAGPATSAIVRAEPASQADPAVPVPDPRCRAARRLFLRAAIDPDPPGVAAQVATDHLLDQAEGLADGAVLDDMAQVRALARRLRENPRPLTDREEQTSVERMQRLLIWTMTTCPAPQRPVWGCASPVIYGQADMYQGPALIAGQLVPDEAVTDRLGEQDGRRVELARNQNHVVYAWTDPFGLVRRRVEVQRLMDLWFVTDARRCEEPVELDEMPEDEVALAEELPDVADGPEFAASTTTTTAVGPTTTTVPVQVTGCGYNPQNTTDKYDSLSEYMTTGPAEPACWQMLSPAGRACIDDVTAAAPSGNPNSDDLYECFDL